MSNVQQEINARIVEFIEFKGLSLHKFGELAHFASGGLSRAIKEDRTFSVDKLMNIYRAFPELNPIWLQFGRGRMIADGYKLIEAPGKVKTYHLRTTEVGEDQGMTLEEAIDKIRELEKNAVVLEAKNETLLEVLRNFGYMGVGESKTKAGKS